MKDSLAIAYSMKRKSKKNHRAEGEDEIGYNQAMAQGGEMEGRDEDMEFSMPTPSDKVESEQSDPLHDSIKGDIVDRVMRKMYSEGGKIANDTPVTAGFESNNFDDLVKRDDLTSTYGHDDNSGDDLGNKQEDENRHDIVSRIMRSRSKRDRNPRPA